VEDWTLTHWAGKKLETRETGRTREQSSELRNSETESAILQRSKIHARLGAVCSQEKRQVNTRAENRKPKILAAQGFTGAENRSKFAGFERAGCGHCDSWLGD
jgi:hypothetical protein